MEELVTDALFRSSVEVQLVDMGFEDVDRPGPNYSTQPSPFPKGFHFHFHFHKAMASKQRNSIHETMGSRVTVEWSIYRFYSFRH